MEKLSPMSSESHARHFLQEWAWMSQVWYCQVPSFLIDNIRTSHGVLWCIGLDHRYFWTMKFTAPIFPCFPIPRVKTLLLSSRTKLQDQFFIYFKTDRVKNFSQKFSRLIYWITISKIRRYALHIRAFVINQTLEPFGGSFIFFELNSFTLNWASRAESPFW